jgi:6-phosphogluconolactonase
VGELDSRLHILGLEAGPEGFPEIGIVPTHAQDADPESARDNLPSHLVVSADGALVYVANRGRNTIGVIRRGEAPELVAEVPCGGDWPRHIALAGPVGGQGLLVALERGDAVVHLPFDAESIPRGVTGRTTVRRPGFVLPLD